MSVNSKEEQTREILGKAIGLGAQAYILKGRLEYVCDRKKRAELAARIIWLNQEIARLRAEAGDIESSR